MSKILYIIAGCNGAGKTTASFSILPTLLKCKEFINADEIARGLSPFKPESMAIQSAKLMLSRIQECLAKKVSFAIETTLSGKNYIKLVHKAQLLGYHIKLLFFWIDGFQLAIKRVAKRVQHGGHHIAKDVIKRRYFRGINNLLKEYIHIVDSFHIYNNSYKINLMAEGNKQKLNIIDNNIWDIIKTQSNESKH